MHHVACSCSSMATTSVEFDGLPQLVCAVADGLPELEPPELDGAMLDGLPELGRASPDLQSQHASPSLAEQGDDDDDLPVLVGSPGGLSPKSSASLDASPGGLSPKASASPDSNTSDSESLSSDVECQDNAEEVTASEGSSDLQHSPMMPTSVTGVFSHMDWAWRRLRDKRPWGQICSNLSKGPIKHGSLCSGIDVSAMSWDGLGRACAQEVYPRIRCRLVKEVICEVHPKKFNLLMQMHPDVCHAYKDVLKLSKGPCWDYKMEAITDCSPDVLFAGFSCCDLSALTKQTRGFKRDRKGKLKSGPTFFAVADCARRWRCRVLVLENVRGLLWRRSVDGFAPIEKVDEELRAAGFLGTHRMFNPEAYGIPQRRTRVYLLYYRAGSGDAEVAFDTARLLQARSPTLPAFLEALSPTPVAKLSQRHRRCVGWPSKHETFQTSHSLRPDVIAWAESVLCGFTSGLLPREVSLLTKRYAYLKQVKDIDATTCTVVLQIDQELDRCPTGVGVVPCVAPKGAYWVTCGVRGAPRLLAVEEVAQLQSIGPQEMNFYGLHVVPARLLRDLVGNAFNGAVCNMMLLVALSSWQRA